MKKRLLLTALFFAVFLILTPAFAQEEQAADGQAAAGGSYTIKKGDTLWDISKSRLSRPFRMAQDMEGQPVHTRPGLNIPRAGH